MIRVCVFCEKPFEAGSGNAKVCRSDECRRAQRKIYASRQYEAHRERTKAESAAGRKLRKEWRKSK
jgi:hypothetical protein